MLPLTQPRRLPVLFLALAVSACAGSDQARDRPSRVDALPVLEYVEEVRVGSVDDPDVGFSRIEGVEVGDDGTVYVLEGQVPEIRVFAPDGRRLRTVGRPGEGPGEFRSPREFGLLGDTLWVNDWRNRRISWFGPDGELVHELRATPLPVETDVPGMFLSVAPARPRSDGLVESEASRTMSAGAADRPFYVPVIRFDRNGRVVDTARWDTVQPPPTVRVEGRALHPPALRPTSPVTQEMSGGSARLSWWVPAGSGQGQLEVARLGADGDTLYQSVLLYDAVPVPASVRDSLLEGFRGIAGAFGLSEGAMADAMASGLDLPDYRPPIRSTHGGRDGSLWIALNGASPDSTAWVLLDPDGAPRGGSLSRPAWSPDTAPDPRCGRWSWTSWTCPGLCDCGWSRAHPSEIVTDSITTSSRGRSPLPVGVLPMARTTSIPSFTLPNTACLPSSQGVAARVMKNWDPPVLGPALAMDRTPSPECLSSGWNSSGIVYPGPPVPVPRGSPPWIMNPSMTRWKMTPS